jgi:hypothetical protein
MLIGGNNGYTRYTLGGKKTTAARDVLGTVGSRYTTEHARETIESVVP